MQNGKSEKLWFDPFQGLSNREIGDLLGFTEHTAKFHLKNILAKLQVSDRTEAATAALERGILQ